MVKKYVCYLCFIGNELLRGHHVKTELFAAELMASVKPFTRYHFMHFNHLP
ncbi:hypothetical protein Hanom_Chr10g00890611 [Helianthus anomalus]